MEKKDTLEFEYTPFGFDLEKYVERYEESVKKEEENKLRRKKK